MSGTAFPASTEGPPLSRSQPVEPPSRTLQQRIENLTFMKGYQFGKNSCAEYERIFGRDLFDDIKKHLGVKGGGRSRRNRSRRNRRY